MTKHQENIDILALTTKIVSAHVSNNHVDKESLPSLIQEVYHALTKMGSGSESEILLKNFTLVPPVPVENSVFPDYLVCLEDGKPVKMLRRYLKRMYNMTPEDYRRKWGLPSDYPMVAENYSIRRSALAKQSGLGKHRLAEKHG
jgi:predicted transcriptional regulator